MLVVLAALAVGVTKPGLQPMTFAEQRSHFGGWLIVSSPLVLSLDPANDTAMDLVWPFVGNPEAIAVCLWLAVSHAYFVVTRVVCFSLSCRSTKRMQASLVASLTPKVVMDSINMAASAISTGTSRWRLEVQRLLCSPSILAIGTETIPFRFLQSRASHAQHATSEMCGRERTSGRWRRRLRWPFPATTAVFS